jgi:hypothetical protein
VIGIRAGELVRAIGPGLLAAAGMTVPVLLLDWSLPPLPPPARLGLLVAAGVAAYALLLLVFARPLVREVLELVRRRPAAAAA